MTRLTNILPILLIIILLCAACVSGGDYAEERAQTIEAPRSEHFMLALRSCRREAYRIAPYDIQMYVEFERFCMGRQGYPWKFARYNRAPDTILAREIAK